jgi:hypothetical protein
MSAPQLLAEEIAEEIAIGDRGAAAIGSLASRGDHPSSLVAETLASRGDRPSSLLAEIRAEPP